VSTRATGKRGKLVEEEQMKKHLVNSGERGGDTREEKLEAPFEAVKGVE